LHGLRGPEDRRTEPEDRTESEERQVYPGEHARRRADWFRRELIAAFGPQRGAEIEAAEVYEISEYASRPKGDQRQRLFPTAKCLEG